MMLYGNIIIEYSEANGEWEATLQSVDSSFCLAWAAPTLAEVLTAITRDSVDIVHELETTGVVRNGSL